MSHLSTQHQYVVCMYSGSIKALLRLYSGSAMAEQNLSKQHQYASRPSAYVSIRQHTSAYVSIRQHTSAYVSMRQHRNKVA
jgi:hypothetical protein